MEDKNNIKQFRLFCLSFFPCKKNQEKKLTSLKNEEKKIKGGSEVKPKK